MYSKDLVSIIIPMYNVEQYISECLESVINQDYKNMEIIIVNDGSTDNSLFIAEKYELDCRVKIYTKTNGGLSSARNYGIKRAKGKFIVFIDSDDYIASNFISDLLKGFVNDDIKIAMCRYSRKKIFTNLKSIKQIDSYEALTNILYQKDQTLFSVAAWNKMYRKEVFEKIEFPENKLNEDMFVICEILKRTKNISICDFVGYYYRINQLSITQQKFSAKRMDVIKACDHIMNEICINYNSDKILIMGVANMKFRRSFEMLKKIVTDKDRENYSSEEKYLLSEMSSLAKMVVKDHRAKFTSKITALLWMLSPKLVCTIIKL